MFKIGDLVVYGSEGVCFVSDILSKSFSGISEEKKYYVLEPIKNKGSKLYVPMDNQLLCKRIRSLLSYEDVIDLINENRKQLDWISDNKLRSKYYKDTLNSGNRKQIFGIAKQLYEIKNGKHPEIKKLYTMDEDILRKTTQILYSELSLIANVTMENVLQFICGEIKCEKI